MQLILMRHGEPVRGGANLLDPELCPAGLAQARDAVPYLRRMGIDEILSSPQLRAHQTAQVVGEALARNVVLDGGLVEFDHGAPYVHYDGGSAPVWRRYLAGDLSDWGITAEEFTARVRTTMNGIAAAGAAGATVLAVCHGGVMNAWACALLGERRRVQIFEPDYASLSRFVWEGGEWGVLSLNERPPAVEGISTNK